MRQALELALEALTYIYTETTADEDELIDQAITTIKDALAQPEQEPVALEAVYESIIQWDEGGGKRRRRELARRIVALYTTPPQRIFELEALLERQTARIVDLQTHIENLEG